MDPLKSLPGGLTVEQCDVILSLVSIAENSSINWRNFYNYAENIHDGRGITISLVGFCTGTWDFIQVLEELQKINPNHHLVKYIPKVRAVDGTSSTKGLENLIPDIHNLGDDKEWKEAVWKIIIKLYWGPAMDVAKEYGCKYAISKGFLYDLALNHGSDEMEKMIIKIKDVPHPINGGDEKLWLAKLIDIRQHIIVNVDRSTNNGQPDRCIMWRSILNSNNVNLNKPLYNLVCYGDVFHIKKTNTSMSLKNTSSQTYTIKPNNKMVFK